ncbi:MAG: dihydroorotate dehydrogenase-like protein [Gammaproteobacteria bacterium]|nr:dihydroorotate dehydrogenase-like protein [Gammaproteobacteria bacterium]MCW8959352.1 dihydroorotate dehydrogenase-like protein [Gammaproteobacteria bacterium]MCW8973369.1 dihydroorotate dehydrogenase-like protein [Gammaproteobacteria bacterium]MCW8993245.1 dihydroorotate dehydrogenase-like protein [Gammaproteobacteria bacterium]
MDLSTNYLGLQLKNPVVPSASPLSRSPGMARALEDAGASALVMYSLFEEELQDQQTRQLAFLTTQELGHSEAESYLPMPADPGDELDNYLEQIRKLKESLSIPVIASLNGISNSGWVENGKLLTEAGADALELNVYYVAADLELSAETMEQRYLALLSELRKTVSLPITVKLSPFFSSLGHFVSSLEAAGANGVALFNRFYQPDIDVDSLRVAPALHLSQPHDNLLAMRWLGILHGRLKLSLAATGGIHSAEDAIKMLLAGADITHLCSTLLLHGPKQLTRILNGIEVWLEESPYDSIEQIKGVLSHQQMADPAAYERASYVKMLESYAVNRTAWD